MKTSDNIVFEKKLNEALHKLHINANNTLV